MQQDREEHWTNVYQEKAADTVSWYQQSPEPSLEALERFGASPWSSFIDVGGGASNLVDALLDRGWRDVTVLDIAAPALDVAKERLGARASEVEWIVANITDWSPARRYGVWHDRAVFHFLTERDERAAYHRALSAGLVVGGLVILSTFALDGPERCSGLPVERYGPEKLTKELGPSFLLLDSWKQNHLTPWGSEQAFNWCAFRRRA